MVDQPSPEEVKNQIAQLKQWLDQQPHIPKNIDEKLYLRFLHSCYYDMEKAKTAADLFFSIRSSAPEILTNRDPLSPPMQKALKIIKLAQYKISGNRNLWIWQLNDPGLLQYDYVMDAKVFFVSTDSWLLDNDFMEEEDIAILDVKDISLKFITKFNVSIARKLSRYQEDAMPVRLKQIHILNTPNVIDKIFALMKPFLKQDMTNMIHFHTPKSTTLYDYISKDELPEDFGGTHGKMDDYTAEAIDAIMKKREIFLDDNFWRCDKKSNKNSKIEADSTTEIGSFRTLAID